MNQMNPVILKKSDQRAILFSVIRGDLLDLLRHNKQVIRIFIHGFRLNQLKR